MVKIFNAFNTATLGTPATRSNAPAPAPAPAPAATNTISGDATLRAMNNCNNNTCISNAEATKILKKPPFAPNDVNLFMPQVYSSASTPVPAAIKPVNETEIKAQLTKTLAKRGETRDGMAVYNDPKIKSLVPDPRLRAALASLVGTPGEAAVDSIKNGDFSKVQFGNLPGNSIAGVGPDPSNPNGKPVITFNSLYQSEDFRLLAPALAHETLHVDKTDSVSEERINNIIDSTIYGKLILEDPQLAQGNTELTRRLNTKFMARLNSRDANGNLRIFSAQGNVYPGGTPLDNFGAAFSGSGTDTTGNSVLGSTVGNPTMRKMLKAVTGVNASNANFDSNTENLLDQKQIVFSPTDLVTLARTLKLQTN